MLADRGLTRAPMPPPRYAWLPAMLFWAVAAVPIVVVLTVPQLVLQDGGLHLSNAVALQGLFTDRWPDLLAWRAALSPNITAELSLLGLLQVFGADTALRVVTVLGMLGYAAVIALLMRALKLPSYAGIPLLVFEMHFLLMMGFLGFVWAVPLGLAAVVIALRRPLKPAFLPLTILLTATWLTHIVPALVATLMVVAIVLCAHRGRREPWTRCLLAAAKHACWPAAPVIVLSVFWLTSTGTATLSERSGVGQAMKGMVEFSSPLVAYAHIEYWLARAVAVTCFLAAAFAVIHRIRRTPRVLLPHDGILVAGLLVTWLAVILPENSGSGAGFIGTRLALFAAIMLMLWVATQWPLAPHTATAPNPSSNGAAAHTPTRSGKLMTAHVVSWWIALTMATVVAVGLPLVRIQALTHLSGQLQQIRSLAPCLPQRSTFVQLNLDNGGDVSARGMSPMAEQTGHIAVERQALDLGNESGWYPFYLWRYTDQARADRGLRVAGHIDDVPPDLHLADAIDNGLRLDAVIVYGSASSTAATRDEPAAQRLNTDLNSTFQLTATSQGGNAQLWLRRGLSPSC